MTYEPPPDINTASRVMRVMSGSIHVLFGILAPHDVADCGGHANDRWNRYRDFGRNRTRRIDPREVLEAFCSTLFVVYGSTPTLRAQRRMAALTPSTLLAALRRQRRFLRLSLRRATSPVDSTARCVRRPDSRRTA